jgi:tRNA-specific 2-thiouridylase
MGKKVIAAMSGGVDSSAAAALLIEQGYDVIGVTLNVWPSEESSLTCSRTCCSITDVDDARQVCYKLKIPHYVLNMRDNFRRDVIDYFLDEYMKGRTPNPCIACNAHVKFEALMQKAAELGADYVATGHYATIVSTKEGELALKCSKDTHKDQTYVLYMLDQQQLSHLLLPCGGYTKPEVRDVAQRYDLPNFKKPDSQDLCFVGAEGYAGFIRSNCGSLARVGNIISKSGEVIGQHDGVYNFTVGQHKGLGKYSDKKLFVTAIDAENATVYVGVNEDLMSSRMLVGELRYMLKSKLCDGARVGVKIRYSAKEAQATIHIAGDEATVIFDERQRAVTPGQAAVFYQDGVVLGGGVILRALDM